jgi:TRAP-type mannitol/chloroaromatic compound transport system permease small subunit
MTSGAVAGPIGIAATLPRRFPAVYEGAFTKIARTSCDMYRLADGIDALNGWIGRTIAWGAIVMGILQFSMVIARYVYGIGSVWVQESITYVFASLFMLGAASALLTDGHVRVDIWYREAGPRGKAIVNLLGTLVFLWPVTFLIVWESWPYVARAFAIREGSRETSGIPLLYLLKAEIVAFGALMALQGLSIAIRSVGTLVGHDDPAVGAGDETLRVGH